MTICRRIKVMAGLETRPNSFRVVWRQQGVRQYETFALRPDAEQFLALVNAAGNRWPYGWVKGHGFVAAASDAPTLDEWAPRAIKARSRANDRTQADYLRDYKRHISPTFGSDHIDQITREQVGLWIKQLEQTETAPGKPLAAKTIKNVQALASAVMAAAVEDRIATANPFKGQSRSLPAARAEEMVFLSEGEYQTLHAQVPEHWQPLTLLLVLTGLRWSEATALQVHDVDVLGGKLRVVRAWKRQPDGTFKLGEPKSRRSRRTIGIPPELVDALLPLVAGRRSDEFVFTTLKGGRPVRHNNFYHRVWRVAVRSMQTCEAHRSLPGACYCPGTVPKSPRIHDLRHSHISWLIAWGADLPSIQRRAGHESIQTTIDRYGHLFPQSEEKIMAILSRPRPGQVPVASVV